MLPRLMIEIRLQCRYNGGADARPIKSCCTGRRWKAAQVSTKRGIESLDHRQTWDIKTSDGFVGNYLG